MPLRILERALEMGGARLFFTVLSLLAGCAFLAFIGREIAAYLKRRSELDADFLSKKEAREDRLTNELIETFKSQASDQQAFSAHQNTINAKTIEALHDLQRLGKDNSAKLEKVEEHLRDTVGWIKGHASR